MLMLLFSTQLQFTEAKAIELQKMSNIHKSGSQLVQYIP